MYYSNWEYHPLYGCYSRFVFKETKDGYKMVEREYRYLNT